MIMIVLFVNGLFNIVGFLIGLIALVVLFGIVSRTKDEVKRGFIFILFALVSFIIFEFLQIFQIYQIIDQTIAIDVFSVVFVLLILIGMWQLRSLIRGLSDFGQAFILTSNDKHDDKLVSLLKGTKNVCYVTLNRSYGKVVDLLDAYNIDSSKVQFIDASGVKCDADNCIEISNTPDDIKVTLDRLLKEKDLSCVIIDDIAGLKNIEKFELPKFVQDTSSLIKSNEVQGLFIGKLENLDKNIINDITMLVDKVIGDEVE